MVLCGYLETRPRQLQENYSAACRNRVRQPTGASATRRGKGSIVVWRCIFRRPHPLQENRFWSCTATVARLWLRWLWMPLLSWAPDSPSLESFRNARSSMTSWILFRPKRLLTSLVAARRRPHAQLCAHCQARSRAPSGRSLNNLCACECTSNLRSIFRKRRSTFSRTMRCGGASMSATGRSRRCRKRQRRGGFFVMASRSVLSASRTLARPQGTNRHRRPCG